MNIGVYVGSFNPIHIGHLAVIKQAENMFDNVIVGVGINYDKTDQPHKIYDRAKSIRELLPFYEVFGFSNVFDLHRELTNKYPHDNITYIRGVRDFGDLDSNYIEILHQNGLECVLIKTPNEFQHISSGAIREMQRIGEGDKVRNWLLPRIKIIGVVGKICSGKSTFLKDKFHLEVDVILRNEIINFCNKNRIPYSIDEIKQMMFSNDPFLKFIEVLTKPLMFKYIRTWIQHHNVTELYVEDAMAIEQNRLDFYDEIVYLDVEEEVLIERLMSRNSITRREAIYRLSFFKNTNKENIPASKLIEVK